MALEKITQIAGRGVYVPGDDLDTDRIIPARFMKCITFDGLGEFAFYDARAFAKEAGGNASARRQSLRGGFHPPLWVEFRVRKFP
jgi:3-isopropylmalate dehydratase small subunit